MTSAQAMLLHIIARDEWERVKSASEYRPASLDTEGFIHLSEVGQVLLPANTFYKGQTGLVLLVIDPARLSAPVRYDAVPGHGTFPHLYGPLNPDSVTAVLPFAPNPDGTFTLPEELRLAP